MPEPKGYGWLNAGWGTGAFVSVLYAPQADCLLGGRRAIAFSMALLAPAWRSLPSQAFSCSRSRPISSWDPHVASVVSP